jgi:hypothetical protein
MILIRGLSLGILLIAHYVIWVNTQTWPQFLKYVILMNLIGALIGIPSGIMVGRGIKKIKQKRKVKDLYGKE